MKASRRTIRISSQKTSKNSSKLRTIRFALSPISFLWMTLTNRISKAATTREFKRQRKMPIKLSQSPKSSKSKNKTCSKSSNKRTCKKRKCREHSARSQIVVRLKSHNCNRMNRKWRNSEDVQGMSILNWWYYQECDKKAICFI